MAALWLAVSAAGAGAASDTTRPRIEWTGNAQVYALDETVNIRCTASDEGSGLIRDTCADVRGPALSFGVGNHRVRAIAVDRSGNSTQSTLMFSVRVTPQGLCEVIRRRIRDTQAVASLCAKLRAVDDAVEKGDTVGRSRSVAAFVAEAGSLRPRLDRGVTDELVRYGRTLTTWTVSQKQPTGGPPAPTPTPTPVRKTPTPVADRTAPRVSFAGNAAAYRVDQRVDIDCNASDGSGVAWTRCPAGHAPAYSFAPGQNRLSASAADRAGNVGRADAAFAVTVTAGSLCSATRQAVRSTPVAAKLCASMDALVDAARRKDTRARGAAVDQYVRYMTEQRGKTVDAAAADGLVRFARVLLRDTQYSRAI